MTLPRAAAARDVVVVGAVNVDLVVAADRLPGPGETVLGPRLERFGGGKGANAAVAAARSGARVRLVAAVGDDDLGAGALAELAAEGIDVAAVAVIAGESTGVALIVVDPAGENQIAVAAGANARLGVAAVAGALEVALPTAGCVLVSTEIPPEAVAAAVRAATTAGVPCVLNPAPVIPVVIDVLASGPILTPNRSELIALAAALDVPIAADLGRDGAPGPGGVASAAGALAARTGAPLLVTLGADGALLVPPHGAAVPLPAHATTVRDTTGAGDTVNGVLAAGLASGLSVADAARRAGIAAALSVAGAGARGGMPDAAQLTAAGG